MKILFYDQRFSMQKRGVFQGFFVELIYDLNLKVKTSLHTSFEFNDNIHLKIKS